MSYVLTPYLFVLVYSDTSTTLQALFHALLFYVIFILLTFWANPTKDNNRIYFLSHQQVLILLSSEALAWDSVL